jgi:RNA polymerase sigma factor (sigma-70 family)
VGDGEEITASNDRVAEWDDREDALQLDRNLSTLENCIEKLTTEQRSAVQLFYIEEKCYREIADQTGYELGKVKSYIQNGKRKLKICMEQNG